MHMDGVLAVQRIFDQPRAAREAFGHAPRHGGGLRDGLRRHIGNKGLVAEQAPTVTLWLLVLLTPINAGLSLQAGFELPTAQILGWLVVGGVIMMAAQYLLTWAYAASDAAFVQPFDDLKLISNILIYGLAFGYWPEGNIWAGVTLILMGSLYLLWSGRSPQGVAVPA